MTPALSDTGTMNDDLIWLTESQVASLVEIDAAMDALRVGFLEEAAGNASSVNKALGTLPNGAIHALGSMMPARGFAGFKTWAHTNAGATAIFSLFDTHNGRLLAVLEAATLGQIRTAAVSGLAGGVLAAADADEMALIGTGAQALTQVAAVAAVRRLKRLRVYSPTAERRTAFVKRARDSFAFEVVDCSSLEQATDGAPIVTLITRTQKPFLHAGMVAPGALVIAAGAILPANAEFFPDLLDRADSIVVDNLSNAQTASRELIDYFGGEAKGWEPVLTLGAVLADRKLIKSGDGIKLFKPMGTGLSDLSVAIMAYESAQREGVGLHIRQPRRVMPTWRGAPNSAT
jgi:ornithine cyclodeaminase